MAQIKIISTNVAALSAAANAVEGRAHVNTVSGSDFMALSDEAENKLDGLGIPKNERAGASFDYVAAGPCANAYGNKQGATAVRLVRRSSGWYLDSIRRTAVYPKSRRIADLAFTQEQKDAAVARYAKRYYVRAVAA